MAARIASSPGLLTALNFDTYNRREICCATSFGANVQLHDYTGRHGDIWTDWQGNATFTIPANAYCGGQSYLCFSRAGADQPLHLHPRETTQVFIGAEDLDIAPAAPGDLSAIGRIYVEAGSATMFGHAPSIAAALLDEAGTAVPENTVAATGWYTVAVRATGTASTSFELSVKYRAPKKIK